MGQIAHAAQFHVLKFRQTHIQVLQQFLLDLVVGDVRQKLYAGLEMEQILTAVESEEQRFQVQAVHLQRLHQFRSNVAEFSQTEVLQLRQVSDHVNHQVVRQPPRPQHPQSPQPIELRNQAT
jgi:hypothetical protein